MADDLRTMYAAQMALIESDTGPGGLKELFDRAVREKWTAANFQAQFMASKWYQTHYDSWRVAETARLSDPPSWQHQLDLASDAIKQQMTVLGFTLSDADVASLASQSLYLAAGSAKNIDAMWLKSHVVQMGRITGTGGTVLSTMDQLRQAAYMNGVSYNDAWFENAAKDILGGTGTAEGWAKQIRDAAMSKYPTLAEQLKAGQSVMDVASPYIQQMAATFEMDPSAIKLEDPTIQKALTSINTQNNQPQITPLWQFSRELKSDDRYFQTNQAHQDMSDLASEIARQFGRLA